MSMCCGAKLRKKKVTNSHNFENCMSNIYLVRLFCMCGLSNHTYKNFCNVKIALLKILAYHKIIQANWDVHNFVIKCSSNKITMISQEYPAFYG